MNAVDRAQELVRRWRTNDPFELCEYLNIRVLFCDLPESVRGFYHALRGHQLIYLNQEAPEEEQREVCAHELGHAVLHDSINSLFLEETGCFNRGRLEREADQFCAELLVGEPEEGESAGALARRSGVSEQLVRLKYGML